MLLDKQIMASDKKKPAEFFQFCFSRKFNKKWQQIKRNRDINDVYNKSFSNNNDAGFSR
jgi:hypothetical protein